MLKGVRFLILSQLEHNVKVSYLHHQNLFFSKRAFRVILSTHSEEDRKLDCTGLTGTLVFHVNIIQYVFLIDLTIIL